MRHDTRTCVLLFSLFKGDFLFEELRHNFRHVGVEVLVLGLGAHHLEDLDQLRNRIGLELVPREGARETEG